MLFDLISRSALKVAVASMNNNLSGVQMLIDNAPAVDAVEVVRCKDCKSWKQDGVDYGLCLTDVAPIDGDVGAVPRWENDFCSYGERRSDDGK